MVDVFVEELDLAELGFGGADPEATGRPSYHPSILLKLLSIYGYLNRVQSKALWLEYEAGRNVEVMWLLGRLVPDHKTIADFRKDNSAAIRKVCAHFIALCRAMGLLTQASVAIDGSKFKAVNNRDKNFTRAKMERRMAQIEESVARYLEQLDTADRQEPSEALQTKTNRLKEKIETLKQQMRRLENIKKALAGFLALKVPIELSVRRVYENGDVGFCTADWSIAGKAPDGKDVKVGGTSVEVVKKTSGGNWVYVIDSPYGTA